VNFYRCSYYLCWAEYKLEITASILIRKNKIIKMNNSSCSRSSKVSQGQVFRCDVCEKSFSQKGNLMVHWRTHTGEKPFPCDVCEKWFNTKSQLTVHRRIHTGEKPFPCDVCEKSFSQSCNLKVHRRTHTREKPNSVACVKSRPVNSAIQQYSEGGILAKSKIVYR